MVYLPSKAKRRKRSTAVLEEGGHDSDESELSDKLMRIVGEVVPELSRKFMCFMLSQNKRMSFVSTLVNQRVGVRVRMACPVPVSHLSMLVCICLQHKSFQFCRAALSVNLCSLWETSGSWYDQH